MEFWDNMDRVEFFYDYFKFQMSNFLGGKWKYLVVGAVAVVLLGVLAVMGLPDGRLHLWYLDVGQGDAILMRLPAGEWILNDGGPDGSVVNWLSREMPFYERTIDLVVLSHPHADHLDGLVEVLKRYRVKNIMMTGVNYDFVGYDKLKELVAAQGLKVIYVSGKSDYRFGKVGLDMIYPVEDLRGRVMNNLNNSSIVYRLIYGKFVAFFSGDLEMGKEAEVLQDGGLHLKADILKAGHHGSKTSNTGEFLKRINPQWAVISCGVANQFGHPDAGTLARLWEIGARVFRTDIDGTVEVVVGSSVKIKTQSEKLWN